METLSQRDPFRLGVNLYVNWVMKKSERQIALLKQYNGYVNETNIFTKNLKPSVTFDQLHKVFS